MGKIGERAADSPWALSVPAVIACRTRPCTAEVLVTIGKKALLIMLAAALYAASTLYGDYRWFFVAAALACTLRALVFTRRF
jgi:hypothetical protein